MSKAVFRPTIHIFPLSRLVHAPAPSWEKLIALIEQGKEKAFAYYLPMREAVVLLSAKGGRHFDSIRADMVARARQMGGVRGDRMAADNDAAFRTFADNFLPKISKYKRNLLRETQGGVQMEGITLYGSPHMEVLDSDGNTRYIFLHAANWPTRELKVYLQLLAVIVEKKYRAEPEQLWCMDLKTGKTIKFKFSRRLYSRCTDAAKHYARLARAMTLE